MQINRFENAESERYRRKQDKRVSRTKRAIHNAFVALVGEKDFNDITIKDIAERAGINRKTFYYYYAGIHSLVDEIENGFASALKHLVETAEIPFGASRIDFILRKTTEAVSLDVDFFRHLMKAGRDNSIIAKLTDIVKNFAKKQLAERYKIDENTSAFIADFYTAGLFEIYRVRFADDKNLDFDEIADKTEKLFLGGLRSFLEDFERLPQ